MTDTTTPPRISYPGTLAVLILMLLGACADGPVDPPPSDAPTLVITPAEDSIAPGATLQLTATLRDADGVPLTEVPITWHTGDRAVATLGDSSGLIMGVAVGRTSVTAAARGVTATAVVRVIARLVPVSGAYQQDTVNHTLGAPLAVRVTGPARAPVAGIEVAFAVVAGGGSVTPLRDTTDALGLATTSLTLGTVAGVNVVTATSLVLGEGRLAFGATGMPDRPARLSLASADRPTGFTSTLLAPGPAVRADDRYGNPVRGALVSWTVTEGDGSLNAPTTITDPLGLTGARWTLGPDEGEHGLQAELPGVAPVAVTAVGVWPGTGTILYALNGDIYATDPNGANSGILLRGGVTPVWSPDGTRIAFTWGAGISVMNADGAGRTTLTTGDCEYYECREVDSEPAWSPDGSTMAFTRFDAQGNPAIYRMNTDGSEVRRLGADFGLFMSRPQWSPDGSRVAFSASCRLYTMDRDGENLAQVATAACGFAFAWSPDGSRFALDRGTENGGIYLIEADGTPVAELRATGSQPGWSWDGKKLAFFCGGVCSMNADGSGVVRLSPTAGWLWGISWKAGAAAP